MATKTATAVVVERKAQVVSGPTLTSRIKILTFREVKLEDDALRVLVGNYQKGVEIIDKRKEVRQNEELRRILPFANDSSAEIRKEVRAQICRILNTTSARVHFDRKKQVLTLFPANGHSPKGVLFTGLVKIPFEVEKRKDNGRIMWRGFPLGNGRAAVVVLSKSIIHLTSGANPVVVNP